MFGFDLSGCAHKKQVKMRNKQHFITSCIRDILLYFIFCHILCIFLKFSPPSQNVEFHIHQNHMEIGLSKMIKFCRKMIQRTHFKTPYETINLLQDVAKNFSRKNFSYGYRCPQDHEGNISTAIFMINRMQLKFKNY